MANPIIQAVYDLKDLVTAKLRIISNALSGNRKESDKLSDTLEKNNARTSASFKKTAADAQSLQKVFGALAAFVGLRKLKDGLEDIIAVGEEFDDLGKKIATAFGAIAAPAALEQLRTIAAGVPQSFEDVTAAAIKLKQAGFDPLDGTLQALIDNLNATDGTQEALIATIDALAKANIKGGVTIKNLVALVQGGIPVFDLLGKAMGISADRVRELASTGKLGQDSIRLLVTELGKLRAGASAAELGDFDAQLQKVKDQAREFLNTIATSGALDAFREGIADINKEIAAAAKDGRLATLGKSISDGIVTAGKAIRGAVGLVVEYSGALITLGKVYLTFRAINIASHFIETQKALNAAAAATKLAGTEAEAAAAKVGALGKAARGIPEIIKFSVVALALDATLSQLFALNKALREESEANTLLGEKLADVDQTYRNLAIAVAAAKNEFGGFADTAILTADELAQKTQDQIDAYAAQLDGARKFYQALIVEARQAGDAAGLESAKASLAEVNAEIALVNTQLAITKAAGAGAGDGLTDAARKIAASLAEVVDDAKATKTAIEDAFTGFDFSKDIAKIGDFSAAFDSLANKGGKTAETLNKTLVASLKELTGTQLLQFQSAATAALEQVGADATKASSVLKDSLEVALDRLGVKAEDTGAKITKSGADTIATFTAVAENATASAATIAAAFDAALGSAKTADEARALGDALAAAFAQGKIGAQAMTEASRELDERLRTLTAAVSPLADQFKLLGIKTQAELIAVRDNAQQAFQAIVDGARNGTAAQEDVIRAFRVYADAARAAAADSNSFTKQQVESNLAILASTLNITDAVTKAGTAGKDAGDKTADAFGNAADKIQEAADASSNLAENAKDAGNAVGDLGAAASSSAADVATQAQGIVTLTTEQTRLFRLLAQDIRANGGFLADYEKRVQEIMQGTTQSIEEQEAALKRFNDQLNQLNSDIAGEKGDTGAQEDIRHKQRLADLLDEFNTTDNLTLAQFNELKRRENELHELKLQNIKKQADAQAAADAQSEAGSSAAGGSAAGGGAGPNAVPAIPGNISNTVNLEVKTVVLDNATLDALVRQLAPAFERFNNLGG